MKKQVIFLLTTFIFIISMCGAVSAIDAEQGGESENNTEIIISGQVLDCTSNDPFEGVNVTVSFNGTELSKTKTDSEGKYQLNFFSNLTQFNVTASSNGHKSSVKPVNLSVNDSTDKTLVKNVNFQLGKPKVLFILYSANPSFIDTVTNCDYLNITIMSGKNLPATITVTDYDMIFVDWLSTGLSYCNRVAGLMNESAALGIPTVMTINYGIKLHSEVIIANGNPEYQWMRGYWGNMSNINAKELLKFIGINFFNLSLAQPQAPVPIKNEAIYHPDANNLFDNLTDYLNWYAYKEGSPTVGILFHQTDYKNGDFATIDALIRSFENKGYNVLAYFYPNDGRPNINKFLLQNNKAAVDLIIHYKMFGWSSNSTQNQTQADLEKLNVPILKAYKYFANYTSWLNGTQGMQASSIGATIVPSEMDGMINPIIISTQEADPKYALFAVNVYKPIDRQINWLVNSSIAWINLRYESNTTKKIAMLYWQGIGKDTGVIAGHLDVYGSISNILEALKNSGYNLGNNSLPDNETLVKLIRQQGLNIGVWAPGELENLVTNYPVVLVPESEYLQWFNELNETKRQEVIAIWGEPPGDIMVYMKDNIKYLVLPVIQYGNVILAPEPNRGYSQDDDALYHSGSVPPTHQYLAFYFWLKKDFGADAIIDLGRHGTVAWLPGKTGPGLDRDTSWPAVVSQEIPVIYPFTIEGSEGLLPKRTQGALMISHLIPSMTVSGLYGNLSVLNGKIESYNAPNIDAATKTELKNSILLMVKELKINEDIGVNITTINDTNFDDFLQKLSSYLDDISSEFIPYGLHTFGEAPEGYRLTNLVQCLLGYDFQKYMENNSLNNSVVQTILTKVIIDGLTPEQAQLLIRGNVSVELTGYLNKAILYSLKVKNCTNEMDSLLDALNGEYISTGMSGDPIINPEVLPTGSNFYSFDPRIVPTPEATKIGNQLAQDIIDKYKNQTGNYPTKVSFVLWACHTQQDLGVMEAAIFYLLGVQPVRDSTNKVVNVTLIPNLNRPRIDVTITTTALYLSMYRSTLDLIDQAVRLASTANDTQTNYVKQNSETIYQSLIAKAYSPDQAKKLSMCRIFSQEEGNHNNAMQNAIISDSDWETEGQFADTFIGTFGNVFMGSEVNSVHLEDLYTMNLNGTQIAMFSRSSNENDLFGDSDYFGYYGGLGLTIRDITGNDPFMWIMNVENPSNPKIETLSESLWKDARSTYLNPKYISEMMNSGASAAGLFADYIRYLRAWDITSPDSVNDNMYQESYDTYFNDKNNLGINKWFDQNNPFAQQSMAANLLDVINRGYWTTDTATAKSLANYLANNVINNGMACCDCTCGNLALMQWATQYMNPNLLAKFKAKVYASTKAAGFAPEPANPNNGGTPSEGDSQGDSQSSSSSSSGSQSQSQSESQSSPGEEGQKAYEVSKQSGASSSSSSGLPFYAIIGIFALVGLVGAGYYFGPKQK